MPAGWCLEKRPARGRGQARRRQQEARRRGRGRHAAIKSEVCEDKWESEERNDFFHSTTLSLPTIQSCYLVRRRLSLCFCSRSLALSLPVYAPPPPSLAASNLASLVLKSKREKSSASCFALALPSVALGPLSLANFQTTVFDVDSLISLCPLSPPSRLSLTSKTPPKGSDSRDPSSLLSSKRTQPLLDGICYAVRTIFFAS